MRRCWYHQLYNFVEWCIKFPRSHLAPGSLWIITTIKYICIYVYIYLQSIIYIIYIQYIIYIYTVYNIVYYNIHKIDEFSRCWCTAAWETVGPEPFSKRSQAVFFHRKSSGNIGCFYQMISVFFCWRKCWRNLRSFVELNWIFFVYTIKQWSNRWCQMPEMPWL